MLGLGHAILTGEPLIGNEPFAVVLADDLCDSENHDGVLSQMLKIYQKYKCSIVAIQEIPKKDTSKYGVIAGTLLDNSSDIYEVENMIEKPSPKNAPSNLAIIGRYILTPDIFEILKDIKPGKNSEIQITDALRIQAKQKNVLAYKFRGTRFDCGNINGYINATNYFARKMGIKIG